MSEQASAHPAGPARQPVASDPYIRDRWYAVALSRQIQRALTQTWLLGEPLVLYRTESNEVIALSDRCPHRHAPLSVGTLQGDEVQCRYHGFQFDKTGRCTRIPGETTIPRAIRVQPYPTVEALGFVWAWSGDPNAADTALLPEFPWTDRPEFCTYYTSRIFEAPFDLIVDNLMDLTHVHFVHRILGVDNLIHESEPMQVWETGNHVLYRRNLQQARHTGTDFYAEIGGEFIPPSLVITRSLPKRRGSDDVQPGPVTQVLHCLTPRTAESTSYLAVKCWSLASKPHEIAAVEHQVDVTLDEDKAIIEAQYRTRRASPVTPEERLVRADRAAVMARRVYERLLREERTRAGQEATA